MKTNEKSEGKIKQLKTLLKYLNKSEFIERLQKFQLLSTEIYGISYNDKNIDEIIDCIDYGNGKLSFEEFDNLMKKEKLKDGK